ncbi:MAG TPA: ABC transporter substrate-binding protein [Candidatus Cybelea sp.]|nr:ABC transporter substrate-binding protein [Candidatus Cybelea sp.]
MRTAFFGAALAGTILALSLSAATAADKIKIGYVSTLSGPASLIGVHQTEGFFLAVEELGGVIGGLPADISKNDDQAKPDVARQVAEKLVKRDQVDVVTGVVYSNVMLGLYSAVVDSKTIMLSSNAGPSQIAGKDCSPYFFSTSWQNDEPHAAVGALMQQRGIKRVVLIASNYQAGQDAMAGFKSKFKGTIVDEIYPAFNQPDYSAEITKIASEKPDAVYAFVAAAGTLPFAKQYAEAGLMKQIPLYSGFMFNPSTFPAVGDVALGARSAAFWTVDLDNPASQHFVAAYRKKYQHDPTVYAAQAYDSVRLLDAAVREIKGKVEDRDAFIKALATVRYDSVRGPYRYNNNHMPIENFYATEVVKDQDGHLYEANRGLILKDEQDAYHQNCPMK